MDGHGFGLVVFVCVCLFLIDTFGFVIYILQLRDLLMGFPMAISSRPFYGYTHSTELKEKAPQN